MYKTHSRNGDEVASGDISNGSMTKNLPAGYYLVSVGEGKYKRKNKRVYLDQDREIDLELEDIGDSFKIYGQFDNTTADYDLNLKMKTPSGDECIVNNLNRRCPYAEFR